MVQDIVEFARRVSSIVAGLDFDQFVADEFLSITVLHYMQDIGEAARGLSPAIRKQTRQCRGGVSSGCETSSSTSTGAATTLSCGARPPTAFRR